MADITNLSTFLSDVANAIREKKGTEGQIPAANFDTEIKSIPTGGGSGDVKLFETQEEMQADTTAKEGDLAVVYRSEIQNMTADIQTQYITFPETVTLPEAFTDFAFGRLRAVDESVMFDGNVQLDKTSFRFDGFSETGMIRVSYTSSDGITYTREEFMGDSGDLTNPVDLGTIAKYEPMEPWNDALGYFMQTGGMTFDGLYEYNTNLVDKSKYHFPLLANLDLSTSDISIQASDYDSTIYTVEWLKTFSEKIATDLGFKHSGNYLPRFFLTTTGELCFITKDDGFIFTACPLVDSSNNVVGFGSNELSLHSSIRVYKVTDVENMTYSLYNTYTGVRANSIYSYVLIPNINSITMQYSINSNNLSYDNTIMVFDGTNINTSYRYIQDMNVFILYNAYLYAQTQLSLSKASQLLPGIVAYGRNGPILGDESVYDNLDKVLTTKHLLPNVPTDMDSASGHIIEFYNGSDAFEETNKIQQLVRDNASNIFVEYSNVIKDQYGSIGDGDKFVHNNKIYILSYESSGVRGPDLWYYRIDANTGELEQFKKTVFSNKHVGVMGTTDNFQNTSIDINEDSGDIYFMLAMTTSGNSEMKLCKASISGDITSIYDFTVPKIYNAEFLGFNKYNNCLYYVYTTDNKTTKIKKVTLEGVATDIYSIGDTSRIQNISGFTDKFIVVALTSINKLLVINKETDEVSEITGIDEVKNYVSVYEVDNNTINISLAYSNPKLFYTISMSTKTATKIEANNIAPSSSVLWSDDSYAYGLSYIADKTTGKVIKSFTTYSNYSKAAVKNSNYELIFIAINSSNFSVTKYYPVKVQDIDINQVGILTKWVNKNILVNISDVDLSKLSTTYFSEEDYNQALNTAKQIEGSVE